MSRPSKGSRLKLLGFDQDLIDRLQDFREASNDAKESTVLENAVQLFIKKELDENDGIKRRYIAARKRRGKPP
jgi:predicted transcriptional regulator